MDGSLVRTRCSGSQRLEPFRNGRLHNRKPCFAGSTASHSPSKFTAIRVPVPPTYPHPAPRFDESLADGRRSASQQSRAFSQPTSAHGKACLAMRLLSLTVETHSDPSVRADDISTSDAPQPRTGLLRLTDRIHSKPSLHAAAMPTSKPRTSGRHRARSRAKRPHHPPVCPKAPNLPRAASHFASTPPLTDKKHSASSPFNADLSTHAADVLAHANTIHRGNADSQGQSRGADTTAKRAWRSRAYAPSSRYAGIVCR